MRSELSTFGAWTAVFDSYDQRNDDLYYVVSIHEAGHEVTRFMIQLFPSWAGESWAEAAETAPKNARVHCARRAVADRRRVE